ncbi:MAG: RagB/SusD family nutrient uptake outer membrane protein [Saprospiraceae bacterium]|nr:RagB/SusD family nutrient uptake outer membrane protein [Candidatus Vicinibacter affinis]
MNAEIYTGTPKWAEAESYCDSVIQLGIYNLEAKPLLPFVKNNDNSVENIFTIPFDSKSLKGFRLHMRTLHYLMNQTYDMLVGPWNGCAAVEDHYNSFTNDDLRKQGFIVGPQFTSTGKALFDETARKPLVINPKIPALIMDGSYTFEQIRMSGARIGKFEIAAGTGENLDNDFPLFRYADILLMAAEAKIRQGKNGDNLVNQVRQRAGVATWSGTTLDMILAERGRDVCEGHRRQDLIRLKNSTMPGGQNLPVALREIYSQSHNGLLMPIQI